MTHWEGIGSGGSTGLQNQLAELNPRLVGSIPTRSRQLNRGKIVGYEIKKDVMRPPVKMSRRDKLGSFSPFVHRFVHRRMHYGEVSSWDGDGA